MVRRLLQECPKLCTQDDKEGFLVKLMDTMDEIWEREPDIVMGCSL